MPGPTPVCVGSCFTVDDDGKLQIALADASACHPGAIVCTPGGLQFQARIPVLDFQAIGKTGNTTASTLTFNNSQFTTTVKDTGSASGLWTVASDRSVTVNCDGVYAASMYGGAIANGATKMIGEACRIFVSGQTAASFQFNDLNSVIKISNTGDGPEANCSFAPKFLAAGTLLQWRYVAYSDTGSDYDFNGEFNLAFLGGA